MDEASDGRRSGSADSNPAVARAAKRPRTTLACQRCKTRKQRCDGRAPSCSPCLRVSAACQYVASTIPKPTEQRAQVKALESKIADLESRLKRSENSSIGRESDVHPSLDLPPESSLLKTIRDLSLNASGDGYLGGTSNIAIARVLESVLHVDRLQTTDHDEPQSHASERDSALARVFPSSENDETVDNVSFSDPVVERLFHAYIEYVSLIFPIMHSPKLVDLHARRDKPSGLFDVAVLHLMYALGGITLTLSGAKGDFKSEYHYEAAMAHRARIIQCIDRRAIIYLTLASLYCLRAPRSPGPWTMIGLAVKLCISLGLHRKSSTPKTSLGSELDKRLFWTCYCLDRDINLTMGRPPSICDHDIDCPLPLDVDEDSTNPEHFRTAMKRGPGSVANPPTTMSYFIHMVTLKRIASGIQHAIYRVDRPVDFSDQPYTAGFLARLNEWKRDIPIETSLDIGDSRSKDHFDTPARLHLRGSYMIQYFSCVRLLLFPQLIDDASVNPRCLRAVVEACSGVCKSFKQLHQRSTSMYYSPLFTMSLFLAGLTLVYCVWKSPEEAMSISTSDALSDCTIMLYVMAERWPKASRYRDAFERLKQLVLMRPTAGEGEDNILLDEPGSATADEIDLSDGPNAVRGSAKTAGYAVNTQAQATRSLKSTDPAIPHIIRDIVGEPFSLWEGETFNLNFEALMPTAESTGNNLPTVDANVSFEFGDTIASDFSFSPMGFEHASDYDFDPVTFEYPSTAFQRHQYGGILEAWPEIDLVQADGDASRRSAGWN